MYGNTDMENRPNATNSDQILFSKSRKPTTICYFWRFVFEFNFLPLQENPRFPTEFSVGKHEITLLKQNSNRITNGKNGY